MTMPDQSSAAALEQSVGEFDGVHVTWADASTPPVDMACRNCGAPGPKPVILDAHVTLPYQGVQRTRQLQCPVCGCAFAQDDPAMDYELAVEAEKAIAFYVEVAAGLWPIVRALARLRLPPGSTYLEIGCGFGFGLDYALRSRGWTGRGIDPSPFAIAGRDEMGLPIETRYFQTDEAAGTDASAIFASEVIEHMSAPIDFVKTLRAALRPGGVLVLTTPDRHELRPDNTPGQLVQVLSVGAHIVLQTAGSLRQLLHRAGFAHVEVFPNVAQLVAYASDEPLDLQTDASALRADYRAHLERRTAGSAPGSVLWWGFAGRAYQEAVVDSDWAAADMLWAAIAHACRAHFGFDAEDPATYPDIGHKLIHEHPDLMPPALPTVLYARSLHRMLGGGEPMTALAPLFRAMADVAHNQGISLNAGGQNDMSTVTVERNARSNLAAVAADEGAADALAHLRFATDAYPEHALELARRSFVGLVNAGRNDLAHELLAHWDVGAPALDRWPPGRPLDPQERDTLFCLGVIELGDGGNLFTAIRRFARVREAVERGGLYWAALRGECVAADQMGDRAHADTLLVAAGTYGMPMDLRNRLPEP